MRLFTSLTVLFIAFLINAMPGYGQEDLKISVTASHLNASPGEEVTYIVKYSNVGSTPASNVRITCQLPDPGTFTYVSSNPQGVISGDEITWDPTQIPQLALLGNEENEIVLTIRAGVPGESPSQSSSGYYIPSATVTLNSRATIKSENLPASVQSNAVSTIIQQVNNAQVSRASGYIKSATHSTVYYLMQIKNTGNVYDRYELTSTNYDCDGVGGKGYDPLEATFTDGSGNIFSTTDWIAPGQTYFLYLKLTAGPGTNPKNYSCHDVIATSVLSGTVVSGNTQTIIDGSPNVPYPDLSIVKTAVTSTTPAIKGGSITYTLNYKNSGTLDAPNVQITDIFDDVHTNITDAGGGTVTGNEATWNIGLLSPGQSGSLSYSVLIDPTAAYDAGVTIIPNKALISSYGIESNYKNNTTVCNVPVNGIVNMTVEVFSENNVLETGKENTYTIKISNIGNTEATGIILKDKLPADLTIVAISDSGINTAGEITWPAIPNIAAGNSLEYSVKVMPSCSEMPALINTASVSSATTDMDEANNSSTVLSAVVDQLKPSLANVPVDVTVSCDEIPQPGIPSATDNCDSSPVVHFLGETSTKGNDPLLPDFYNYTIIRTWDATDASGNHSDAASQTITVQDHKAPAIPVLSDFTSDCSASPEVPTTTDNCRGMITGATQTAFPITTPGITVVEWTFDDGNGNITTASQNVIVGDVTPPDTPVLADVNVGECSGTPLAPTTMDNCAGIVTGTTTTVFPITTQGTTVVEWTFDDGNGNTTTATQNVIVDDVTPPVTPELADVIVGECEGTPETPTTTDNCGGIIMGTTTTPFPITMQGTTVVEWTFDDGHGNTSTATQNVIVDDVTPPVEPILADVIVGECSGTPLAPTTTDNCAGIITGTTSTLFPITKQGGTVVEWSFDDGHGNITTAHQNIIVDDVTPPVAPALADVTVGECSGTPVTPITTDNCTGIVTGTTTTAFPITTQGTTVVVWTFDDGNGNTTTASQNVTVKDHTLPLKPVLADVTVGECSGTPVAPTTTDNCKGIVTGTTTTAFPITTQGTTVVEWTFDDGNGNTITASQNVIVKDHTPPVTPILADITVGECSGTPEAPTTMDNCTGVITGTTTTAFPITTQGTTVVEWTFDDGNGNKTTARQNVIVKDTTIPQVIGSLADLAVEGCTANDASPAVTTVDQLEAMGLSITDACAADSELTVTYHDISNGIAPIVVTRTYTISDPSGNRSTSIQSIRVIDTQKPVLTCPIPQKSYPADDGKCTYTVLGTDLDPLVSSDNCSVKSVTNDFNNTASLKDAVFPLGKTTVTWTVEDISGNSTSSTYEVAVIDTQLPTFSCATPAINYPSDPGVCSYTVTGTDLDPVAITDNCSVKSITNDFNNTASLKDAVFPLGKTTVTWTVEDNNGNRTIHSYDIVVVDKQKPVITCVTPAASYSYNIFDTELDPGVNDNCGTVLITNDFNNSASLAKAVFPLGSTVVTWTATDESGNSTTCSYTIVITDTQAPVINCATVADHYATDPASNIYEITGTALDPTVEDNYGEVALTNNFNNSASLMNAHFPVGQSTVIWTATDKSGNSSNCTQIIKVSDLQNPTITCPADINVVADAGKCSASIPDLGEPITADNCSVAAVSNDAPATFPSGITSITWTATDASGNTATCIQKVTVKGTPQAVDDIFTGNEDEKISGNVMTNDEACQMTVIVQSHSQPTHGTLTIDGNGNFTYTPDDNYYGMDSFTYRACSAHGDCSEATVNITVESVDDLPQAVNDNQLLELDLVLQGNVAGNDLSSGDDGNVWSLVTSPSHGTIDFHPDGTYSYTATTDFLGSDSFTYQICDQDGDCSQARVSITIEDVISPNQILTPNGDLINDTFIIEGIDHYPGNKLTIYNRWGNVVYRKNDYQNEWDGASNGNKIGSQSLPVGTYYYLIDYGKNRHKTGYVYLDR